MALLIPPGFAQVGIQLRNDADPDPWYVTWGVDLGTIGTDLDQLGAQMMVAYWNAFGSLHNGDTTLDGVQLTIGQDGGSPIRAFIAGVGDSGSDAAAKLPQNCALMCRKNTNQGGRRNQGRIFVPNVLNEDTVSATGVIVGTIIQDYQEAAFTLWSALDAGVAPDPEPTPMVILHSEGVSDAGDPTVVSGMGVDTVISTQRRRLR